MFSKKLNWIIILILFFSCTKEVKDENINKKISQQELNDIQRIDFIDMIKKEIIRDSNDFKYISNIHDLENLRYNSCDSISMRYRDFVRDNKVKDYLVEVKFEIGKFIKNEHKIEYAGNEKHDCSLINGNNPWGGYHGCPSTEVKKVSIKFDGNNINTSGFFDDIYDVQMCGTFFMDNFQPLPKLKYDRKNDLFYLYIIGGNAADTYFGKYIFNRNRMITRYILHYGQLSRTASFRSDFEGF